MKKGPVMIATVLPAGPMAMGKNLVQWFLFSVVVGVFSAYISGRALAPGAPARRRAAIAKKTGGRIAKSG
jgi:hypothetical protein